jgi:hypothetical protein
MMFLCCQVVGKQNEQEDGKSTSLQCHYLLFSDAKKSDAGLILSGNLCRVAMFNDTLTEIGRVPC